MDTPIALTSAELAIVLGVYFTIVAFVAGWATALWLQESRTEVNNLKESDKRERLKALREELLKAQVLLRDLLRILDSVTRGLNELEKRQ